MPIPDKPLRRVQRGYRKTWLIFPLVVAQVSLILTKALLQWNVQDRTLWFLAYVLVGIILLGVFLLVRREERKLVGLVRAFGPRVRDADYRMRRGFGLIVALDSGILFQLSDRILIFHMFFGPDGSSMRPNVEDVLRWTKTKGLPPGDALGLSRLTTILGTVSNRQVDNALGARLEALRVNSGARAISLAFREWKTTGPPGDVPHWETGVAFLFLRRLHEEASRVLHELDSLETLLKESRTATYPPLPRLLRRREPGRTEAIHPR